MTNEKSGDIIKKEIAGNGASPISDLELTALCESEAVNSFIYAESNRR